MARRVLILGSSGKMGMALGEVFAKGYEVVGKNSKDFDAGNFDVVKKIIEDTRPDIVINSVAFLGIDQCESDPQKAFLLNSLYPKLLASLSCEYRFLLVHFSTDAVFDDSKHDFYVESDLPRPLNIYGFTKYGGDCFIQAVSKAYYIFRVSLLFGLSSRPTQFVEKMLDKIRNGAEALRISGDIICSPTYSSDVAGEVLRVIEANYPAGIYHIANGGKASLYELMREISTNLKLNIKIEKASYKDFPFMGIKNTNTPLRSERIDALRPWQEAAKDYCGRLLRR